MALKSLTFWFMHLINEPKLRYLNVNVVRSPTRMELPVPCAGCR